VDVGESPGPPPPGPRKSNPLGTIGPMSNPDPIAIGMVKGRNFHARSASLPPPLKIANGGATIDDAAIITPF